MDKTLENSLKESINTKLPTCDYKGVFVEIKTKRETVVIRMLTNVQTKLVGEARFFNVVVGKE